MDCKLKACSRDCNKFLDCFCSKSLLYRVRRTEFKHAGGFVSMLLERMLERIDSLEHEVKVLQEQTAEFPDGIF